MCKVLGYFDLAPGIEVTLSGLMSYQVSQVFEVLPSSMFSQYDIWNRVRFLQMGIKLMTIVQKPIFLSTISASGLSIMKWTMLQLYTGLQAELCNS